MADIKIRAKEKGGVTEVKALISHPMETGNRKDSNGDKIPEHFIQEVTVNVGEKTVMTVEWGPAVSKNPYLAFKFKGAAKGDTLTLSWVDNKGESASLDAEIK
jgi:sulfur-oxidizing protein SoxZ